MLSILEPEAEAVTKLLLYVGIVAGAALVAGVVGWIAHRLMRRPKCSIRNPMVPPMSGGPWPWMFCAFVLAAAVSGCMERAVIVPPTVPVRLAEPLSGVAVWVKEAGGGEVKARADLFPGMIIVTDPADFPTAIRARMMNLRRDD